MPSKSGDSLALFLLLLLAAVLAFFPGPADGRRSPGGLSYRSRLDESLTYLWPLPKQFRYGDETLSVDPDLFLQLRGAGGNSSILRGAFDRYRNIIFAHPSKMFRRSSSSYDLSKLTVTVDSDDETLQLGVDESYTLIVGERDGQSIIGGEVAIEANTVYGAMRGLETFSQLCSFNYKTKTVEVFKAPWYIQDEPKFAFRGLLLDTSRHYIPTNVIKQVIESMSYAKL